MKTALIFPGQGSQFIGMGHDFYQKYDISREVYQNLDNAIERNLSKLIFFGEENDLSETQNSQPSIMASSIAVYEALIYEKLLDKDSYCCVAGHSLGEYSALVVNGCLKFDSSVKLLKTRSKAMQDSMPLGSGGMVALIGCDDEIIDSTVEVASGYGKVFIANDNAKGQVVLSGEISAIDFIRDNAKALDIKRAIKLNVSAPFHCELINSAAEIMEKEVSNFKFESFNVPLYSNVTAESCNEKAISKLLIDQITSKVRWREIIENMIRDNVTNFIEIGPGNILTNLVKRISKDVKAISISKLEDLEKLDNIKL